MFVLLISCKKETPTPKQDELPQEYHTMMFIQWDGSQPIQLFMTDSLGNNQQGNLNDCRSFYQLPELDRNYYFFDVSNGQELLFTVNIQNHSGVYNYDVTKAQNDYFLTELPTVSHCGSNSTEFDFQVGIFKQ